MEILYTVNRSQLSELSFGFKSAEITDSGADEKNDGTISTWERGTVTLSADCHGEELLMQFDFVEYHGKGVELAQEPYLKYNFRLVNDFFDATGIDAQSIIDSVPWEWHVKMSLTCV